MRALDILIKKRDGHSLSNDEINFLVESYSKNDVPDYQMSAFTMAVFFNGMSIEELSALTKAMLHSGHLLKWPSLNGTIVDKHSTGGVGDKASLPLAPMMAALGVHVPMISGRGLGHTGGTLDKLQSIPGFKIDLPLQDFQKQVQAIGCALIGQTKELAPADKKLYALRDVTGTVESIPLISSSIMSKKLAEGLDGLVLDVKYGSGAFMRDPKNAYNLAKTMVDIATQMNTKAVARLTSMDQPLGVFIGNSLEIIESTDVLKGNGPRDLVDLVVELGAEMLILSGLESDFQKAKNQAQTVLKNGKALEKWVQIIEAQGGDPRIVENYHLLEKAPTQKPILATESGYVSSMNTYDIGIASTLLGGGRQKTTDVIDPRVGIEMKVRLGDFVHKGDPLCILHSAGTGEEDATLRLNSAFSLGENSITAPSLFGPRISNQTT